MTEDRHFKWYKDIWIAVTDNYMYFYSFVLFLLVAILELINKILQLHNLQTFSVLNTIFSIKF